MKHIISFPGLGIGEFEVDRVAFTIGERDIMWYGVIITLGMVLAVCYILWRTREYEGLKSEDILDYAFFVVIFGIIGARLYYVIFDPTPNYESFIDVIAIWRGGLAIYGGIIGGAAAAICVSLVKKVRIPCFFDMLAPAVMLAQSIGRWGNFINAEAHGGPCDWFIRMEINGVAYHPTFLYESLWNLLGFILLNIFYRKRKFDGQIVLGYLAWYGLGRGLIEGLRTDSLYIGPIRVSQLVGFASFAIALGVMLYVWFIYKKAPKSAMARRADWTPKPVAVKGGKKTEDAEFLFASEIENNPKSKEENTAIDEDKDKGDKGNGKNN